MEPGRAERILLRVDAAGTDQREAHGAARRPRKHRKSFFLRGLVTILPAVLTLFLLVTVVQFAQSYVTKPINSVLYWLLEGNAVGWKVLARLDIDPLDVEFLDPETLPAELQATLQREGIHANAFRSDLAIEREKHLGFFRDLTGLYIKPYKLRREVKAVVHPSIGVLLSLLLIFTLGYLASGFLGRRSIAAFDRALYQVPIVRSVYPYAKQLVEFFYSDQEIEFQSAVAVPYPSDHLYTLGFVTSSGMATLHRELGGAYVSVFIPSSPMPMTGWTVFVSADRLISLPISVDEALRVTVSAGVLIPPTERVAELERSLQHLLDPQGRATGAEPTSRERPDNPERDEDAG